MPPERVTADASKVRSLERGLRAKVAGDVLFDLGTRALYATDASNYRQVPIGIVRPRSSDDVIETVRLCREHDVPILPRGGGTSLAGQCCNVAVVIDMSRYMCKVIGLDVDRRTARVEPGVVLDDLQREAAPHGLMYGPDPATHAWCTFGGMLGNNSCGVRSVKAGLTSDNVEQLDVLTAEGLRLAVGSTSEAERVGVASAGGRRAEIYQALSALRERYGDEVRARYPRIPRRVSGYNLDALLPENGFNIARSLVGSEGTCVTILEATVRLIERPQARALLVLGYPDIFAAAAVVMDVLAAGPIGLEAVDDILVANMKRKHLHEREVARLPDGQSWLLVEFGGPTTEDAEGLARSLADRLSRQARPPADRLFSDPHEMHQIWTVRESALGATAFVPGEDETWEGWEDAAVPPERLAEYLKDFRALLERFEYRGALYGHFGQGCVHTRINFDLKTPAGIERFRAFLDDAADLVVRYGGSLSGEHGDGQSRAELLGKMFGPQLIDAFREFKTIWDPAGLMNPGKVVDPFRSTDNLRRPGYRPAQTSTYFPLIEEGGIAGAALRCVGVGKCRKTSAGTMCPSYMVTRDEQHSTRGRAHLLFEMLRGETITTGWESEEVKRSLDLCLACKACKHECPVAVDMATYKAEFLAHYYEQRSRPLRAHLFGHIDRWASWAARAPGLANALARTRFIAQPLQSAIGLAPQRTLPRFAPRTFQRWFRARPSRTSGQRVVVWSDTFTNYFHPEIGQAAVEVIEQLGYQINVPPQTCCGRPLYDFGFLDAAKAHLELVFKSLAPALHEEVPIVVLEPSCLAVFRDEALRLFPNRAEAVALRNSALAFDEFIQPHIMRGRLRPVRRKALLHRHCHEGALAGEELLADLAVGLNRLELEVFSPDAGCCGMAGAFGFDKHHYPVSIQIGERVLLPAVRAADSDTLIVANGFSCREQIAQTTDRRAQHLAEVVRLAQGGSS